MEKLIQTESTPRSRFRISHGARRRDGLTLDYGWSPREKWITINDFLEIASRGYDKVRLPMEEKVLWKNDGSRDEEAFSALDRIVSHARTAGLEVTVDVCSHSSSMDDSVWRTKTDLKSMFGKDEAVRIHERPNNIMFGFRSFLRTIRAFA